jgi:hypothetical protein
VLAREDRTDGLDEIRARIDELRGPGLPDSRATEIARGTPAVAWLACGVHGDESSSRSAFAPFTNSLLYGPSLR